MNNPHTDYLLGDRQDDDMKTTTVDSDFGEFLMRRTASGKMAPSATPTRAMRFVALLSLLLPTATRTTRTKRPSIPTVLPSHTHRLARLNPMPPDSWAVKMN